VYANPKVDEISTYLFVIENFLLIGIRLRVRLIDLIQYEYILVPVGQLVRIATQSNGSIYSSVPLE